MKIFQRVSLFALTLITAASFLAGGVAAQSEGRLSLLFLGDEGHHRPAERFAQLQPVMAERGIDLTYTDRVEDLSRDVLADYDGLVIFANLTEIEPSQEAALLEFVESGKGFVPIHCASYCFLNSPRYIELVGGQFQRHGTGTFRTEVVAPDHPVMKGFGGFESWDETYVHHKHNETGRTVLSVRVDASGREPWTWVREQGQGRVFYTAWGHDQRTWGHPGFQNLVERGIRWAVGDDPAKVPDFVDPDAFPVPEMTALRTDLAPIEYIDAVVPFYPPGENWGTMGEPLSQMPLPLPAAESIKHFVTPVGFEVELYASDPEIRKPICMNWDERGRLWVAETIDYPNEIKPAGEGRDQITICEDTDGDGRADKFTLFADKLSIPTSLCFANGGVIVTQAPDTLFLKDTDGDDVADERRVLFSGWSTGDTHAGPSNLRYGLDNWIYGMVGYAGFNGVVGGERHRFQTGFFRFRPDGSKIEFLRNTNNNSWGVGFSEEGILFGSTANRNPSVYLPVPNRYYERVRGWSSSVLGSIADTHRFQPVTERVRQVDHHGGYTAGAGHALYTARAWPREYWNRTAFVAGPTGHLVGTFVLNRRGADFQSTSPFNVLASTDEWSAPIMAEVGPDGQLWVIDWYNYIVQHNPTPAGYETGKGNAYETDLRDKRHGRVYRVVYGGESRPGLSLADADSTRLVETLSHPNMLWRLHAQRLLVERGATEAADGLIALLRNQDVDPIGLNVGAIHALGTLSGLGLLEDGQPEARQAAIAALSHPSAGVRRAAVALLPADPEMVAAILDAGVLDDSDPQVRLAALLALSDQAQWAEDDRAAAAAIVTQLTRAADAEDRWMRDAAISAAAGFDRDFLAAALAVEGSSPVLIEASEIVAEHFARSLEPDAFGDLFAEMAAGDPQVAEAILGGLTAGWRDDGAKLALSEGNEAALVTLIEKLPVASRGELILLAGRLGSKRLAEYADEIRAQLVKSLANERRPDAERLDAARQLLQFQSDDAGVVGDLIDQVSPRMSPELAVGLVEAIRTSSADGAGEVLVERLPDLTPQTRAAAIRVLLGRPAWTVALLDGIESAAVPLNDLALDQKQQLTGHPNAEIARRATEVMAGGGVMVDADRARVLEAYHGVIELAGDAAAGQLVYEKHCSKCHVHSGKGTAIGPDLTGMAVHPKEELLTQILDPSRSVEGNYRSYTVVTVDGLVLNGLLASETRTSIELYDTEGKKQIVLRDDIDELYASPKSLMPEGFEEQIPQEEFADLLAFLTKRGQYVPLPLDKVATVVSTRGMFYDSASPVERLVFPDWTPKEFNGVPFVLVDPQGDRVPNVVMLHGPQGTIPPRMPRQVELPINGPAKKIHLLSGVGGWAAKGPVPDGSVSMIVRLHYADGAVEDHLLRDGVHFADYIGHFDVPGSEFAFDLNDRQIRYLAIEPELGGAIDRLELIKGEDRTAPVVMAITVE